MLRSFSSESGLSQRNIAKDLGHESTVSSVLSGNRPLTRDHIERLSKRFHVSPAVFVSASSVTGSDSAPNQSPFRCSPVGAYFIPNWRILDP